MMISPAGMGSSEKWATVDNAVDNSVENWCTREWKTMGAGNDGGYAPSYDGVFRELSTIFNQKKQ